MKLRFLFLTAIGLLVAPSMKVCADDASKVTGVKIVSYGLVAPHTTADTNASDTNLGFIHNGTSAELLKTTDVIEARVGTSFGVFCSVEGQPVGGSVQAHIRVLHPKITNPETKKTTEVEQWNVEKRIGWIGCSFWTFDHDWEIAPGEWQIQVVYDSKILAEKKFTIRHAQ